MDPGTPGSWAAAGRPQSHVRSYTQASKCSDWKILTVMLQSHWPQCVGEKAEGSRNHGSWSWKRPTWSRSLLLHHGLIAPLGHSGVLCKSCFGMTQAGSLPAVLLGDETTFSVEEIFSSRLVGIFCWLAPAPLLLAGLPQTTLNKRPSPSCLPTVKSMSCFR